MHPQAPSAAWPNSWWSCLLVLLGWMLDRWLAVAWISASLACCSCLLDCAAALTTSTTAAAREKNGAKNASNGSCARAT